MISRYMLPVFMAFVLGIGLGAAPRSEAASLSLVPSTLQVIEGHGFTIDMVLDARDAPGTHPGLYGGEIVLDFDPLLLGYDGFTLAPGVSLFTGPVTGTSGSLSTVSFGFDNAVDLGVVATFQFVALGAPGSVAYIGLADADDFFGTFISYVPTYQPFYPDFLGASVTINAVPLPASAWLLGAGLGVIGAWRSRRQWHRAA